MNITRLIRILLVLLSIAACSLSLASGNNAKQLQLVLTPEKTIVITAKASKPIVVNRAHRRLSVKLDPRFVKHLTAAEEVNLIFPSPIVQSKSELFVLLTREPSKKPQGTGLCGAGYEDYLLLIEVASKKVLLSDKILLQSCLTSQELASDQGNNPLRAMRIDTCKKSLTYKMLGEEVERTITVVSHKFQTN